MAPCIAFHFDLPQQELKYMYCKVLERLIKAYKSILQRLGDPLDEGTLYGPLHSKQSVQAYLNTIEVSHCFEEFKTNLYVGFLECVSRGFAIHTRMCFIDVLLGFVILNR
jgi:hypothetical protein